MKNVDAVLGIVRLSCFLSSECGVHVPLLWSRQLDRHLPLAPLPHLHVFLHPAFPVQLESTDYSKAWHYLLGRRSMLRLVPSSTRAPQPESCRKRVSVQRSPLRHSRRLAQKTLDHCAWFHLGTIAHNLHTAWKNCIVSTCFYLHLVALSGVCLLSFPSFWSGTAPVTILPLSMPPGNLCHAGGRHLRRKPSVGAPRSFLAWHRCISFP